MNKDLIEFAHSLADASGQAILPYFRQNLAVQNKAASHKFDPVTVADQKAEEVLREKIAERYPSHGIIGEEFGVKPPENKSEDTYSWCLDPIDGTRAFIIGLPTWGTLIGLFKNGQPFLGMMDQPYTKERYWACSDASPKKKLSFMKGPGQPKQTIKTRSCSSLKDAILTTTHPDAFAEGFEKDCFQKISRETKMTRYGGDCYSYCLLASGYIDLVVEAGLQSYDIAPLIPIITAAGGIVTSWTGEEAHNGGRVVAAADPRLHAAVLEILDQ